MPADPQPRRLLKLRTACLLLLALAVALPAAGYTVYLKDGSSINAEKQWEVVDGKAVITLPGGTRSTIALEEIDVERSVRANKENLGTAQIIDGPNPRTLPPASERDDPSLGDLIQQRDRRGLEIGDRAAERPAAEAARATTTAAGFPDLMSLERRPFGDLTLGAELKSFFAAQGLDRAQIFQGTQAARPMVEVTTNSEASVFRSLAVAASALVHLRDQGRPASALELLMVTPSRERAGQFTLTPALAEDLLTSRVDVATFFLQNVQF